jgi:hypothetical protein
MTSLMRPARRRKLDAVRPNALRTQTASMDERPRSFFREGIAEKSAALLD